MQNSDLNTTETTVETVEARKAWHAPVVAVFNADEAEAAPGTSGDGPGASS